MGMVVNLLINGLAVYITANILPGVYVANFGTALLVSIVLAIVNTLVKPVLFILTLPATILTFGLFTFVLNALIIFIVQAFVPGFHVAGFWSALFFSLILSFVSSLLHSLTD